MVDEQGRLENKEKVNLYDYAKTVILFLNFNKYFLID